MSADSFTIQPIAPTTHKAPEPKAVVAARLSPRAIATLDTIAAHGGATRSATACSLLERVLADEEQRSPAIRVTAEARYRHEHEAVAMATGREEAAENVNDSAPAPNGSPSAIPDRAAVVAAAEKRGRAAGRPGFADGRRAGAEWDRTFGGKAP